MKNLFDIFNDRRIFKLLLLSIIALAIFLRFYNYIERINVHSDHSLFLQAAIYASRNFVFPQVGPFPQAPFFTGPWWLWFLQIILYLPLGILTPWYVMSFISIIFIILVYWLGKEIGGKWLGLIASLFAAISPAQINNSFSVWNAAADPFLALLATIFLIRFYRYKNPYDIFLLGFMVSLATTIHFQTGLLASLILVALLFSKFKVKNIIFLAIGVIIPILPFLFFDLRFNWFWFRSAYIYVTVDQYLIWVPNRWLTYAGVYWPTTWASIVGGNQFIGSVIIFLLSILTILRLKDFKKYKLFYLVAISFAIMVILFRYYRGEKFFYFSNFAHPAVIILSSWVLLEVFKYKKAFGIILMVILSTTTLLQSFKTLGENEITFTKINVLKNNIYSIFPSNNFNIYGCAHGSGLISQPLSYMIYYDNRDSLDGLKIGVCDSEKANLPWTLLPEKEVSGKGARWLHHDTSAIYKDLTEWWKENPPK